MQSKKNIILIAGVKQSGKTTLTDYLISKLDGIELSFASPLKDFLINVFGLRYEQCYGTDAEKNSLTSIKWSDLPLSPDKIISLYLEAYPTSWIAHDPLTGFKIPSENEYMTARQVMQIWGSDICRHTVPNCWASATMNLINESMDCNTYYISDCRFPNELEVFKDFDPIVIKLERNIYQSAHKSETALNNYDFSKFKKFLRIDNSNMTLLEKNELCYNFVKGNL